MKQKLTRYINTNAIYSIGTDMLLGKKNIIVPVVMMMEGVHSGSAGPILHTAEELGKIPESWNGIPVVINHPEMNGKNVSANNTEVIEDELVGRVFNTHMDGLKLKADVYLEEDRIRQISPETLQKIQSMSPIDVSVGVFTEDENVEGEWNGEHYIGIARNYRPDHLALLPEDIGACSWEDGCGIRLNKKQEGGNMKRTKEPQKKVEVNKKMNISQFLLNKQGYKELIRKVQDKLYAMDNDMREYFLEDIFDDYMVYRIETRQGQSTLYKQGYSINENEEVEFLDDIEEVIRKLDYQTINNKKGEKVMIEKKECTSCIEAKVNELIANKQSPFTEDDREYLLTQKEEKLDTFMSKEEKLKVPEVNVNKTSKKEEKTPVEIFKETLKKPEDFINLMPKDMQESIQSGLKLHNEKRTKMISTIMAYTEKVWTEEELKKMPMDTLTKIHDSCHVGTDYSVNSVDGLQDNASSEEVLLPTGVKMEEK